MAIINSPFFHFKRSQKQLLVLVSLWQETLKESQKEISFLEIYISSPIFRISPELLSKFENFQRWITALNREQQEIMALANKHLTVINDWEEIDHSSFEDFLLNEHGKIESRVLDYIKEYHQIKLEIFNYTGDKLIQKPGN